MRELPEPRAEPARQRPRTWHTGRLLASASQTLFEELARQLLTEPGVTQGTMMGYPCLRANGAFFGCVELTTGHLIVKLPARRVSELTATGQALPFAPNGRTFRQWAAFPVADPGEWRALLAEARDFANR